MIKKLILSAFVLLMASLVAMAQSDPQIRTNSKTSPATKDASAKKAPSTDEAAKAEPAEERPNRGRQESERGNVEKEKRGKGKAKGHAKDKQKGKAKGKEKGKKNDKANKKQDSKMDPKSRDYEGPDGNSETRKGRKAPKTEPGNTPQPETPGTTRGRKPGDRPAPGTELKKEKQRG